MEETKKEAKAQRKLTNKEKIEAMIEQSIEIEYSKFHAAVDNTDGTPENYFSEVSSVPSRNVKMWAHRDWIICLHKGKYILVPQSNSIFARVK